MTRFVMFTGLFLSAAILFTFGSSRGVVSEMLKGTQYLLSSLGTHQKTQVSFDFADDERKNWHYVPRERKGLPLGAMTPAQRKLAHALLSTALSNQGLQQANQIMFLDRILYELEGQNPIRDPDSYFVSIFGRPSADSVWGWRFEGHHLSLNFTIEHGSLISTTPAFFGANPAIVSEGDHAGLQVLQAEEQFGRMLVRLLDSRQRERAVIDVEAPRDIITAASRKVQIGAPAGLAFRDMNREQKEVLTRLLEVYARRFRPELADEVLADIVGSQLEQLRFAWAGGLKPGEPHYYRIQTDSFLVEYDNTQNDANHVHTVWRDIHNDFGDDLLKEHYRQAHQTEH